MDAKKQHGQLGVLSVEDLYERYRPRLLVFFLKKGLEEEVAEDLAQEAFFRLLRSKKPLGDENYARNLIYCIAQNLAIDYFRKNGGSIQVKTSSRDNIGEESHPYLVEGSSSPEEEFIACETSSDVRSVVSALPDRYAEAIHLKEYRGFSYREMAESMGVSEKAVESLLHRAREQLKSDLAEAGEKRGGWWSGVILGLQGIFKKGLGHVHKVKKVLPLKLSRISVGAGSLGAGNAAFNLFITILVVGTVMGSGIAASVCSTVGSSEGTIEESVSEIGLLSQQDREAYSPAGDNDTPLAMVDLTRELEPLSPAPLSPAPLIYEYGEEGEEEGSLDALGDVLQGTGETTRLLLQGTGESLDSLLANVGGLLGGITDPLLGLLSAIGVPADIVEPAAEIIELCDVRELSGAVMDFAVDATFIVDDLALSLYQVDVGEGIGDSLAALTESAFPELGDAVVQRVGEGVDGLAGDTLSLLDRRLEDFEYAGLSVLCLEPLLPVDIPGFDIMVESLLISDSISDSDAAAEPIGIVESISELPAIDVLGDGVAPLALGEENPSLEPAEVESLPGPGDETEEEETGREPDEEEKREETEILAEPPEEEDDPALPTAEDEPEEIEQEDDGGEGGGLVELVENLFDILIPF